MAMRVPVLLAAAGLVVACLATSAAARADGLTTNEAEHLLRGAPVVRPTEVERWGRRYVGGVSYAMVDADPGELSNTY